MKLIPTTNSSTQQATTLFVLFLLLLFRSFHLSCAHRVLKNKVHQKITHHFQEYRIKTNNHHHELIKSKTQQQKTLKRLRLSTTAQSQPNKKGNPTNSYTRSHQFSPDFLLNAPELVLSNVLDSLNFEDIVKLNATSHDLHKLVTAHGFGPNQFFGSPESIISDTSKCLDINQNTDNGQILRNSWRGMKTAYVTWDVFQACHISPQTSPELRILHIESDQLTWNELLLTEKQQHENNNFQFDPQLYLQSQLLNFKRLEKFSSLLSKKSLLIYTIEKNYIELQQKLISLSSDINTPSNDLDKNTPLTKAIELEHIWTIHNLLVNGANPNLVRSGDLYSPLMVAANSNIVNRNTIIVDLLLSFNADPNYVQPEAKETALMVAISLRNHETALKLIKHTSNLNCQDEQGQTVLIYAASEQNLTVLEAVLERQPKLEIVNNLGETALLVAARLGYVDNLFMLIKAKANVNAVLDSTHENAIMLAIGNRKWNMVKALIQIQEFNIHFKSAFNENTLTLMLRETNRQDLLDILLSKADVDINEPLDTQGNTPLHYVAKWGNYANTQVLLRHRPNPWILNKENLTAEQVAENEGNRYIAATIRLWMREKNIEHGLSDTYHQSDHTSVTISN